MLLRGQREVHCKLLLECRVESYLEEGVTLIAFLEA